MSLLSVSSISFRYLSGTVVFENVSFSINAADRVAVVGPNGAGKSTLLRLLAGDLKPTQGAIAPRRRLSVALAGQEIPASPGQSLFDLVFCARPELAQLRAQIRAYERGLPDSPGPAEYADRINDYEQARGFLAEAEVALTLRALGFSPEHFDLEIERLSGGERTRAALARALSMHADLLILDEPTNHLDVRAREWLQQELAGRAGASIVTSHDRALLCGFAQRIIEIDSGRVRVFAGGYADYRQCRALLEQQAWAAYETFQREKKAIEIAARRRDQLASRVATAPEGIRCGKDHYARKAAKVQRTARILTERVTQERAVKKPWEEQPINGLSFKQVQRSGDIAVVGAGLSKSYGLKTLFHDLSFHVRRGDRVVIGGENGSGKTTLLNIIRGSVQPDWGSVRFGANVELRSITQDLADLNPALSPLEICGADTVARTLLGCLKLSPDCLNRPVRELSAGERTKVALARLLNSRANLLLLDEPTNHLEIEAQEALERALELYPGTVMVVSHDRSFIEALGKEVLFIVL